MRIELPYPVLPRPAQETAARRLGLRVEEVAWVAQGNAALRDGRFFAEADFCAAFPDDDFEAHSGVGVLPADLLLHSLDAPRDPAVVMAPPITDTDRAAADIAMIAAYHRSLENLKAPLILLRTARSYLQAACESWPASAEAWQPISELMTGEAVQAGAAGTPSALFAVPSGAETGETVPGDAAMVEGGFWVAWQYASIVFNGDGTVRDVFPSCGLRVVGRDPRYLSLVCGGGGVANSGWFGGEVFIRDTQEHRWLPRGAAVPPSLPRFIAGTLGDSKWALVIDVTNALGYRISPRTMSDQCGETFNSACGRYAWDRGRFVLEAATGVAVLDALPLEGVLVGFAKALNGWRFLMREDQDSQPNGLPHLLLKDENNAVIRSLGPVEGRFAFALSADGARLLNATPRQLVLTDADSGAVVGPSFDLAALEPVLRLPADGELWQRLAAAYGLPQHLSTHTLEQARTALAQSLGDEPTDEELQDAINAAASCPPLPPRVER